MLEIHQGSSLCCLLSECGFLSQALRLRIPENHASQPWLHSEGTRGSRQGTHAQIRPPTPTPDVLISWLWGEL